MISLKCKSKVCPERHLCARFMVPAGENQLYFDKTPRRNSDGQCPHKWPYYPTRDEIIKANNVGYAQEEDDFLA